MNLEKNEFMLVFDSTNGLMLMSDNGDQIKNEGLTVKSQVVLNVEDSISLDHLDEKWSVDAKALHGKLEAATEEEFKVLWKNINEFWERNDRENHA